MGLGLKTGVLDRCSLGIVVIRRILRRLFFLQVCLEDNRPGSLINYWIVLGELVISEDYEAGGVEQSNINIQDYLVSR